MMQTEGIYAYVYPPHSLIYKKFKLSEGFWSFLNVQYFHGRKSEWFIPLFNSQANPLLIVCAIIGIPVLSFGISNVFNKRFITVSKSKINYYTKPISIRKEKEIIKSQINRLEVRFSGHRVNNVPSYNIVIKTKDGKTHKLIKHVYNEMALKI